jgi:CubicO group peptidase (beta-lactamase class C family)
VKLNKKVAMKELIEAIVRKAAERQAFSGVVVAEAAGGEKIEIASGQAVRGWGLPNQIETRFRLASVSKMFTAVAVLQLIEQRKLALSDHLCEHLTPGETTLSREITLAHLLTMTSGIADWIDEESPTFDADWEAFRMHTPLYTYHQNRDYLPLILHSAPLFTPGTQHRYNGAGFILLGLVIEAVTGLDYFSVVRQNVFAPAGMSHAGFDELDEIVPGTAEGYVPLEEDNGKIVSWRKNIYRATSGAAADGGATGNAADLLAFVHALQEGCLLRPETFTAMTHPRVIDPSDAQPDFQRHYGYGCFVNTDPRGNILRWGHTGEEDGVSCRVWVYPPQGVTLVVLGNQSGCAGPLVTDLQAVWRH